MAASKILDIRQAREYLRDRHGWDRTHRQVRREADRANPFKFFKHGGKLWIGESEIDAGMRFIRMNPRKADKNCKANSK